MPIVNTRDVERRIDHTPIIVNYPAGVQEFDLNSKAHPFRGQSGGSKLTSSFVLKNYRPHPSKTGVERKLVDI